MAVENCGALLLFIPPLSGGQVCWLPVLVERTRAPGGNLGLVLQKGRFHLVDRSMDSPRVQAKDDLFSLAIWPKLYRRLAKFYDDPGADHSSLVGFRNWLRADRSGRDDLILVLSRGEILNLSDLLTITPSTISIQFFPEDLVIVPR